jgi:hypothetical protein
MILASIATVVYFNLVRFFELREYTTVRTLKDYWKFCGRIVIVIHLTVALIYGGCFMLQWGVK